MSVIAILEESEIFFELMCRSDIYPIEFKQRSLTLEEWHSLTTTIVKMIKENPAIREDLEDIFSCIIEFEGTKFV